MCEMLESLYSNNSFESQLREGCVLQLRPVSDSSGKPVKSDWVWFEVDNFESFEGIVLQNPV